MDQMYLENIEEALEDEGKIVSYKWLSLHLKVSANTAKQMLYEYLNKQKSEGSSLHANYLISGTFYDKNMEIDVYKICVVNDCNLDLVKSKMKTVYSVHLYSLQKCELKDFNLIQASNCEKLRENADDSAKYSHITLPTLKHRPKSEVKIFKEEVRDDKPNETKAKENVLNKPTKMPLQKSKIATMFVNQTKNIQTSKKAAPVKKPLKTQNKNSLSAFLVKKEQGDVNTRTDISIKEEVFQKEDIEPEVKSESIDVEMIVKEEPTQVKTESPLLSSPLKEEEKHVSTVKQKKGESSVSSFRRKKNNSSTGQEKSGKHKRKSKPDCTSAAKRRRILQLDSSDSSGDERMSEDSDGKDNESPFPPAREPSPPINLDSDDDVIPATPQEVTPISFCGRKRVGKLVDKTYTDEEGFLVTKKEYICVSDKSDDENPIPNKKPTLTNGVQKTSPKKVAAKKPSPRKSSPKKSKVPLTKPKQASIMSFFKKK